MRLAFENNFVLRTEDVKELNPSFENQLRVLAWAWDPMRHDLLA